jgi:hypothetical protein
VTIAILRVCSQVYSCGGAGVRDTTNSLKTDVAKTSGPAHLHIFGKRC